MTPEDPSSRSVSSVGQASQRWAPAMLALASLWLAFCRGKATLHGSYSPASAHLVSGITRVSFAARERSRAQFFHYVADRLRPAYGSFSRSARSVLRRPDEINLP